MGVLPGIREESMSLECKVMLLPDFFHHTMDAFGIYKLI